jgi:hypothetical protein
VVAFEFSGVLYSVTEAQATLLAETLRSHAKGKRPEEARRISELSGNARWCEGALAVADFTEEVLVGNLDEPIPLEGKAAEATFWTLRAIELADGGGGQGLHALREAMAERFGALQP